MCDYVCVYDYVHGNGMYVCTYNVWLGVCMNVCA